MTLGRELKEQGWGCVPVKEPIRQFIRWDYFLRQTQIPSGIYNYVVFEDLYVSSKFQVAKFSGLVLFFFFFSDKRGEVTRGGN